MLRKHSFAWDTVARVVFGAGALHPGEPRVVGRLSRLCVRGKDGSYRAICRSSTSPYGGFETQQHACTVQVRTFAPNILRVRVPVAMLTGLAILAILACVWPKTAAVYLYSPMLCESSEVTGAITQ